MSSQKKISSFFMKKANDETIQPGSAGDQGSEELKTGAVADVDVKVRGTDEALVNILTSVTNRPDSKSNFQSIDQSIEVKCFEDIIREVTNIIKAGVELEDTNPAYTTSVTDETDEVEPEDSASCDHVETILESDDDDDDDDDYSVVSDSTVSSIYSTDGQGGGDVTDVFPKGPGALRRPMTADVSCQVFSYPPSLDARPTGPESLRRATSKGIVQESSSRDFRMPSPTIGDEDSASCDHVETILESDDDDDDDDESVVSGSTVSSIYSTDGQDEGDVTDVFPLSTVSSIYSTDGQGEGDVTDVFPKGPGDGFASEFLSSSGADFPGLTTADDEAEEEEETEVTLVQHAAQTSSIIVQKAYYASTCGSL